MATKRGNGEGSIGQYRGRWIARYVAADGKRRALYGATRAEVAKKLAAAIRDRDTGRPVRIPTKTIGDSGPCRSAERLSSGWGQVSWV